jgi:hypothetical protein
LIQQQAVSFADPNQPLQDLACLLPVISENYLLKEVMNKFKDGAKIFEDVLHRLAR